MIKRYTLRSIHKALSSGQDLEMPDCDVIAETDYDALAADRDQISLTLDVAKADRDKWFNRARDLEKALHKAYNQFENITVADTLEIAEDRAHSFIGWAVNNLPGYELETPAEQTLSQRMRAKGYRKSSPSNTGEVPGTNDPETPAKSLPEHVHSWAEDGKCLYCQFPKPATAGKSCQHDLLKPDVTVTVSWDARNEYMDGHCSVCGHAWHIPTGTPTTSDRGEK